MYRPLLEDMTWSYSRLTCFEHCPYQWYLKYIEERTELPQFYASYGSFVHRLLEGFYNGTFTKRQLHEQFLFEFEEQVKGERPSSGVLQKYMEGGLEYFANFEPLPYKPLVIEQQVRFFIDKYEFVGYVDFVGEENGELVLVDHKATDLKPRGNRKKPTKATERLDEMLRQLYLYSVGIKSLYGKLPSKLCFNCYRTGTLIEEPFSMERYEKAQQWALEQIHRIEQEEHFAGNPEYFKCKYLCGFADICSERE